jgi:hypothetical protein
MYRSFRSHEKICSFSASLRQEIGEGPGATPIDDSRMSIVECGTTDFLPPLRDIKYPLNNRSSMAEDGPIYLYIGVIFCLCVCPINLHMSFRRTIMIYLFVGIRPRKSDFFARLRYIISYFRIRIATWWSTSQFDRLADHTIGF